jgi:hypothetical protein
VARAQAVGDLADDLVGVLAREPVVHGPERVGVDHEERQRALVRERRLDGALQVRLELDACGEAGHRVVQDLGDADAVPSEDPREAEQPRERRLERPHGGRGGRQRERRFGAARAQAQPELGPVAVQAGGGAPAPPVGDALGRAREDADQAAVGCAARQLDAVGARRAQPGRVGRRRRGKALRVREVRELRQRTVGAVVAERRGARRPGHVHGDGACAEQRRQSPDVQADQVCGSHASLSWWRGWAGL